MLPHNVTRMPADTTLFMFRININNLRVEEYNFKSAADAAWASDKARYFLSPFLRRKRPYNFPERIDKLSEHEMSCPSNAVFTALQTLKLDDLTTTPTAVIVEDNGSSSSPAPLPPTIEEKLREVTNRRIQISDARNDLRIVQEKLRASILPVLESSSVDLSRARVYKKFLAQLELDAQMLVLAEYRVCQEQQDLVAPTPASKSI